MRRLIRQESFEADLEQQSLSKVVGKDAILDCNSIYTVCQFFLNSNTKTHQI
jgi:hypothetical protein